MINYLILFFLLIFPLCFGYEQTYNKNQIGKIISRACIKKEFEPYLFSEPFLLMHGGCHVFVSDGGRKLIIAIGKTSTKGKSWLEIVKDVGDKPYAELARFRGTKITSTIVLETSKETTTVNGEKRTKHEKTLKERLVSISVGEFRAFPIIGEWYSADGNTYFRAVGRYID